MGWSWYCSEIADQLPIATEISSRILKVRSVESAANSEHSTNPRVEKLGHHDFHFLPTISRLLESTNFVSRELTSNYAESVVQISSFVQQCRQRFAKTDCLVCQWVWRTEKNWRTQRRIFLHNARGLRLVEAAHFHKSHCNSTTHPRLA